LCESAPILRLRGAKLCAALQAQDEALMLSLSKYEGRCRVTPFCDSWY